MMQEIRSMMSSDYPSFRPLTALMRWVLIVASGLVLLAGFQLFILTEETSRYFAWTINPPITAAFLGAAYWASFFLEFLAARERSWSRARIAVPAILLFTVITLVTTLIHIDRFHLASPEPFAQLAAWIWLGIYVLVPPLLLAALVGQFREKGVDEPRYLPLPSWLRGILLGQTAILLGWGVLLFSLPQMAPSIWPWMLTPLTARAIAAWLLGIGLGALHATIENDFKRLKPAAISYTILSVLVFIALVRYSSEVNWNTAAWVLVLIVTSVLLVGLYSSIRVMKPVTASIKQ
jgi:hypothetical protein